MELIYGEIRPGIVLKVIDEYGAIKCSCVGLFAETDDPEMLPPVYPFLKTSPSQFCKPNIGDKVWVLFFKDNPQELFYFFQGDVKNTVGDSLKSSSGDLSKYNQNNQVLLKCKSGFNGAEISFSNEDGMKIANDSSKFNLSKEGEINLSNENGSIDLDTEGVHLSGTDHSVARGDIVTDRFNKLENMMKLFAKKLQASNFTADAGATLEGLIKTYMVGYDEIESPNVTTK